MALAEMFFRSESNSYVMRATARLYLTVGGVLVTENDPAGSTLWKNVGDEISLADAATYGLLVRTFTLPMAPQCAVASLDHSDSTGDVVLTIPANSLVLEAHAICLAVAGGTTRPSIDFGPAEDPDGIFDGLGEAGVCDTPYAEIGSKAEDKGIGALLATQGNEDDLSMKVSRFSRGEQIFTNTQHSAGTGTVSGSWLIMVVYITLPSFAGIG